MWVALQPGRHVLLLRRVAEGYWTPHTATAVWVEAEIIESSVQSLVGKVAAEFVWGIDGRTPAAGEQIKAETYVKKTRYGRDSYLTREVRMAEISIGTRGRINDPAHSDWHDMRCEITALAPNNHYDIKLLETSKTAPGFLFAGGVWSIKRSEFTADAEAR